MKETIFLTFDVNNLMQTLLLITEKDKKEAVKYLEERKEAEKLPPVPPSTAAPVVEPLKGLGFSDEEEEETQIDIQKVK